MPNPVDTMISKGKGAIKSIQARLEGLQGVFRTIAQQHGEVSALLKRVEHDADKRQDLWPKIRMELLSHEHAELREVYPVLRQHAATRALADHHDADARELEQMIARLDRLDIESEAWGALFSELTDAVVAHAAEEEQVIFPAAQEAIGEVLAEDMDRRFLAAKRQLEGTR
jgi:hemerythrin superfamily protein